MCCDLDWKLNNKPIPDGARIVPSFDFGIAKLEIKNVRDVDAGIFVCEATNASGSAASSGLLRVTTESGIESGTQHPSGAAGLNSIAEMESEHMRADTKAAPEQTEITEAPKFTTSLAPEVALKADEPLHLQCQVEPKQDSQLQVDWYHNGLPIAMGSRIETKFDFGQVELKVADPRAEDVGIFTCKARNQIGEAVTFTTVTSGNLNLESGVSQETIHPHGQSGAEALAELEQGKMQTSFNLKDAEEPEDGPPEAPRFTRNFENITSFEGAKVYNEAQLLPKNDSTMKVTWTRNGKELQQSKRQKSILLLSMLLESLTS